VCLFDVLSLFDLKDNVLSQAIDGFESRAESDPIPGVLSRFNSKHPNQIKVDGWDESDEIHISPLVDQVYYIDSRDNERPCALFWPIAGAGDQVDMESMASEKSKGLGHTTEWQRALLRCKKTSSRWFVPEQCMLGFMIPVWSVAGGSASQSNEVVVSSEDIDSAAIQQRLKAKAWTKHHNDLGLEFLTMSTTRVEPAIHGYGPYNSTKALNKEKHTEQINARTRALYPAWKEHAVSVHTHAHAYGAEREAHASVQSYALVNLDCSSVCCCMLSICFQEYGFVDWRDRVKAGHQPPILMCTVDELDLIPVKWFDTEDCKYKHPDVYLPDHNTGKTTKQDIPVEYATQVYTGDELEDIHIVSQAARDKWETEVNMPKYMKVCEQKAKEKKALHAFSFQPWMEMLEEEEE